MTICTHKMYQNSGNLPLLKLLPMKKGGRVLDCGCGAGDNARILRSLGWRVTGITVSPKELKIASASCEEIYLNDLDQGLPETVGNGYDIVLMAHVLEHLVEPTKFIEDVKRVLAPNGMIAVALPNVLTYPNRIRMLVGKFEYTSGGIMDETHLHFYTFASGADLLRSTGYRIVVAKADGGFPLWKLRNILPASFVNRLNTWVCRKWPGLFGFQSLYLAEVGA
jgi:2-polyprenyl-3-methyl-5-hydroxy-6-metoxy-1,4-benzoquinol methylase